MKTFRRPPNPGALRLALSDALRVERSEIDLLSAVRAALGCVIALTFGLSVLGDAGAASATVGALLAGIPSVSSTRRRPLATMAAATTGIALSTFVGSATAHEAVPHLMILAAWACGAGLLTALGDTGSVVGTQATMAFIVFGRFAEPPSTAAKLAGDIAIGGAIQMALVAAARWPVALAAQRGLLADAYLHLALVAEGGRDYPTIEAGRALDAAEGALTSPTLIRRTDVGVLRSLVDEGRRMRVELSSLQALRAQLARGTDGEAAQPDRLEQILAATSASLRAVAGIMSAHSKRASAHAVEAIGTTEKALGSVTGGFGGRAPLETSASANTIVARAVDDHVKAIAGQLRATAALARASIDDSGHLSTRESRQLFGSLAKRVHYEMEILQSNLTPRSTALRHGVRLAVVVVVAELLAAHTPLQRGYWVALTAAIVIRPDFASTFSRGFSRLLGTLVGVGITGLIVAGGHIEGAPAVVTIGILAFLGFAVFRASFAAYSAMLTGLVVLLVNLGTPLAHSTFSAAGDRLIDTLVGGALALLAYALWPTWSADEARAALAETVSDERAYLLVVFDALAHGDKTREPELRTLARQLRLTRTNAEAVVARSLAEPHARRIDDGLAIGVLTGLRRLSLTTHVLRSELASGKYRDPVTGLGDLGSALGLALERINDALEGKTAEEFPNLRELHDELSRGLESTLDVGLVIVEADEIVDVIDTLADLVGARGASQ